MRRSITLALSLLGLFVSLYLLYTYTSPSRPMVCIGTGCDAVRASAYSTLGGVSMPVFGVAGYILLAIVVIAESLFPARASRLAHLAFLGMTGFGFFFSLYLEYLQAFVIHAYCAWCMTSGAVMTALFTLAIVNLVRRGPEPEPSTQLVQARSLFAVCVAGVCWVPRLSTCWPGEARSPRRLPKPGRPIWLRDWSAPAFTRPAIPRLL